ncbi:MAG TPA: CHAT domain-containing protein [Thermoanaerobaculia bacterium]|nr:CHAT domain-containing protein [Thermoanaerobaculia bacterium]
MLAEIQLRGIANCSGPSWELARRGIAALFVGNYDLAIEKLGKSNQSLASPEVENNLAVAYLARGSKHHQPEDFIKALELIERSGSKLIGCDEIAFNKALVLGALYLVEPARNAWLAYLKKRANPIWDAEASAQLESVKNLASRIPDSSNSAANNKSPRSLIEEELFYQWAVAYRQGNHRAATTALERSRSLAEELQRSTGDSLLIQTIRFIDRAVQESRRGRVARLASAHFAYGKGQAAYSTGNYPLARREFQRAFLLFKRENCPFALRAEFRFSCALNLMSLRLQALRRLTRIHAVTSRLKFTALQAESLWMIGLVLFSNNQPAGVLESYRGSINLFEKIGEKENVAAVQSLLAEFLEYQGSVAAAWKPRYEALRLSTEIGDPQRLYLIDITAAIASIKEGEVLLAKYFLDESVRVAELQRNPVILAGALLWRTRLQIRIGRFDLAVEDLNRARDAIDKTKEAIHWRLLIDSLIVKSELEPRAEAKLQDLTMALQYSLRANHLNYLAEIYTRRARAFFSMGAVDRTESDYARAIQTIESWRSRTVEKEYRITFLDSAQSTFEEMALFQVKVRKKPTIALSYLERGRARALLDVLSIRSRDLSIFSSGTNLNQKYMRRDVVMICFSKMGSDIVPWVVKNGTIYMVGNQQPANELEAVAAKMIASLREKQPAAEIYSAILYERLLAPVLETLDPLERNLVFICDGFLRGIPFSALLNRRTNRFLVEDYSVTITPSIGVYLMLNYRLREISSRPLDKILILGDPSFDRLEFPNLTSLPGSRIEAYSIASLYRNPLIFLGADASKSRFLSLAPTASIVQFSGHAISNNDKPLMSRLILAEDRNAAAGSGLYGQEIFNLRFEKTRLVIVDACDTVGGPNSRTEGLQGLAYSFLAAGVPSVVGSIWDIGDEDMGDMIVRLHKLLAAGQGTAKALMIAQVEKIKQNRLSKRVDFSWAAFELYGA